MQDALLIYLIIANMRHTGYFRAVAAVFRHVRMKITLVWSAAARTCQAAVEAAGRTVSEAHDAGMLRWVTAPSSHRTIGGFHRARRRELNQALTRLESYVATMA
jgi:hypothetical protein